ncbi:hypothetical protein PENTCL1PPCAC_4101, partial [Pristionchus entomophagus]
YPPSFVWDLPSFYRQSLLIYHPSPVNSLLLVIPSELVMSTDDNKGSSHARSTDGEQPARDPLGGQPSTRGRRSSDALRLLVDTTR